MVSKCANPDCSAVFRYFHQGKLFRIETAMGLDRRRTMGNDESPPKPPGEWFFIGCVRIAWTN
jgi:hypothetical protein